MRREAVEERRAQRVAAEDEISFQERMGREAGAAAEGR